MILSNKSILMAFLPSFLSIACAASVYILYWLLYGGLQSYGELSFFVLLWVSGVSLIYPMGMAVFCYLNKTRKKHSVL